MKYLKLRTASSVECGIVIALLIARSCFADDETCTFGTRQISQVLDDRPSMKGIVERDDAVYKWVVKNFATGFYGDRIYWDRHEPYSGQPAENQPAYHSTPAFVRVTEDEEISGHDKWLMLVFELHNIKNAKLFDDLDVLAINGKLNRAVYADRYLSLEFTAMLQTQMFFQHNPIEGANDESAPIYMSYLEMDRDYQHYKNWLNTFDADAYDPLDNFGDRFDSLQRNRDKPPWEALWWSLDKRKD